MASINFVPFQCSSKIPPAPFDRVVLAVIGRVVQQLDGVPHLVGKLHHAMEKLRAHATAFGPVIHFTLQLLYRRLLVGRQGLPPGVQGIDHEITGLVGTAKDDAQPPRIFIYQAPRNILLLTPQVVIAGLGITPREPSARKIADRHRPSRNSSTRKRDCPCTTRWWVPSLVR